MRPSEASVPISMSRRPPCSPPSGRPAGRMASVNRLVGVFLVAVLVVAPALAAPPTPAAEWLVEQVKTLAAGEMEGRAFGTPGAARAAPPNHARLERAGLRAGGDERTGEEGVQVASGIPLRQGHA